MTDGEREEANRVNNGNECQVDVIHDIKDHEKVGSLKGDYCGVGEELVDSGTKIGEVDPVVQSDVLNDCTKVEFDTGNAEPTEISCDGELKPSNGDEISNGVLVSNNCPVFESLGCSIQEGLEKVTLGGAPVGLVVAASDLKEREIAQAPIKDESFESESETSSSSSSSSESDVDDEAEKKEREKLRKDKTEERVDIEEGEIIRSDEEKMVSWSDNDYEDGDDDVELSEAFATEDTDDDDYMGPIKSKNELAVLPPVPPVNVSLQPCHQVSPVGVVLSVLGCQVIVEGSEKHNPLSEGSILWITEKRLALGTVDEIFGPVKAPYYIVRYNSESEVPSGIETGTAVGFVPEFVDHVLNDKSLYTKGYDASDVNDEELADVMEFSDDEQEAEYKRMMKMSKRGSNNNKGPGNKRNNRSNRENTWTKKDHAFVSRGQEVKPPQSNQNQSGVTQTVQSSRPIPNQAGFPQTSRHIQNQSGFPQTMRPIQNQSPFPRTVQSSQPNQNQLGFSQMVQSSGPSQNQPLFPQTVQSAQPNQNQLGFPQTVQSSGPSQNQPVFPQTVQSSQSSQNQSGFSSNPPILPVGPTGPGTFPQQGQVMPPPGFMINGMWAPFQQQNMNMAFQNMAFQMNALLQQQQNPQMNPIPWQYVQQQPFDPSQLASMNFANGPGNSAWPVGMLAPNQAQSFPGQSPQMPIFQGMQQQQQQQPNGTQGGQTDNSQPGGPNFPENVGVRPQFNQGSSGRGRNTHHHRGRGGGRGRHQSQ